MSTPQPTPPALIRVGEGREILAYVPHALGFLPSNSVVALSLRPPRGRIGLVARVDLADLAGVDGALAAQGVAAQPLADGAAGVFVVIYQDGRLRDVRASASVTGALAALEAQLQVPVRDVWVVASNAYASLTCQDERCCPPDGHSLALLETTRIAAAMVMAGSAPVGSRNDLKLGFDTDPQRRRAFDAGRRRESKAAARARSQESMAPWRDSRVVRCLELLAEPGAVEPDTLGQLTQAMRDVLVRDAVLAGVLVPGGVTPTMASLEGSLEEMFSIDVGPPDRDRTANARRILASAARLGRGQVRGAMLGVLAWMAWWCGDGAQAQVLVSEALDLHPRDRLGVLVDSALEVGMPPGWVERSA